MSFLSPLLLPALLLASVPIIIHLLNRRRFQLVEWAPMKYLKLTLRTNRRRLRLEQWILLALRTLAIAFLILAVARPVLSSSGVGAWLTSRSRTARVIVIDDSLSMGYRDGGLSAFDRAKTAAADVARTIGPQDSVTAILTSAPNAPLVKDASLQDPSNLLRQISAAQVSDAAAHWDATFKAVDEHLASAAFPTHEVLLITDLRKAGWDTTVRETAQRWADRGVSLKIIDVGSDATDNVVLESLTKEEPVVLPGVPLRLRAMIRNNSAGSVPPGQATLTVGEASQPVMLPELPAGQVTEVPVTVAPQAAGFLPIRLALQGDALPGDDARWLGASVRAKLDITVVDGEPSATPFESETDFLALALTAGREPWQVKRLADGEWLGAPTEAADVTVLANVAGLTPDRVDALERQVRDGGMGLIVFLGDQIDPDLYNRLLFRDGKGLLPARLEQVSDESVTGLVIESADQSPLDPLRRIAPAALARVQSKRFYSVTPAQTEECRVLAHWNNAAASPAVLEKRHGRGRVALVTVPADKQWGDWPVDPTYVLTMRSLIAALARGEPYPSNLVAGEPLRLPLEKGQTALDPRVTAPGATEPELASLVTTEAQIPTIEHRRTPRAGSYALAWRGADGANRSATFCASPDTAESNLEPLAEPELLSFLGNLAPSIIRFDDRDAAIAPEGREIWRTLALVVLGMFFLESAFAVWVGRER